MIAKTLSALLAIGFAQPAFADDTAALLAGALDLDIGGGGVGVSVGQGGVSVGVQTPSVSVGVGAEPGTGSQGGGPSQPTSRDERAREIINRGSDNLRETLDRLSPEDVRKLKAVKCAAALAAPRMYPPSIVELCRLIEAL